MILFILFMILMVLIFGPVAAMWIGIAVVAAYAGIRSAMGGDVYDVSDSDD